MMCDKITAYLATSLANKFISVENQLSPCRILIAFPEFNILRRDAALPCRIFRSSGCVALGAFTNSSQLLFRVNPGFPLIPGNYTFPKTASIVSSRKFTSLESNVRPAFELGRNLFPDIGTFLALPISGIILAYFLFCFLRTMKRFILSHFSVSLSQNIKAPRLKRLLPNNRFGFRRA